MALRWPAVTSPDGDFDFSLKMLQSMFEYSCDTNIFEAQAVWILRKSISMHMELFTDVWPSNRFIWSATCTCRGTSSTWHRNHGRRVKRPKLIEKRRCMLHGSCDDIHLDVNILPHEQIVAAENCAVIPRWKSIDTS